MISTTGTPSGTAARTTRVNSRSTSRNFASECRRMKPIAGPSSRMLIVSSTAPAIGTP
jgi:hypothetical protein